MINILVGLALASMVVIGLGNAMLYQIWFLSLIGLLCLALGECLILWRRALPSVERVVNSSLPLGVTSKVLLFLSCEYKGRIEVFDGVPASLGPPEDAIEVRVKEGGRVRIEYDIKPSVRGRHRFEQVYLRIWGPLGLVARQVRVGEGEALRVVPNFQAVSQVALLAAADQMGQLGMRRLRRRGQGMEFDCLREYREGDQLRQIDWKATARHRRLIARQYEDEKNQQILLVLDCGRRMRARDGELSHFDHALNAGLMLSFVALQQGDSVAVSTFGGDERWIPAQRGPRGVQSIVDKLFDLEATMEPSDFSEAARKLSHLQKRRALVVFVTNLYDADSDELQQILGLLGQRHLVLIASLQEEAVDELRNQPIESFDQALTVAATHHFLNQRREVHRQLERSGALLLDTTPSKLSVGLVNRYLEIKRTGRL